MRKREEFSFGRAAEPIKVQVKGNTTPVDA